ncbi:MAG: hypothetical protein QXZ70_02230 [Candidatus Bathyarchaeia archaeon]
MDKYDSYKILLKNREKVRGKKIAEIVQDLLDKPIPATYGYFFLQEVFLYCQKLLSHLNDYEKNLGVTQCKKLKRLCEGHTRFMRELTKEIPKDLDQKISKEKGDNEENLEFVDGFMIEKNVGLKPREIGRMLISPHPDCLESCFAHVFLFTKNLLNIRGGRLVDPANNDGLSADLKNAKKFHESVLELRKWETDKLWDSVWEPFGGQPSEEEVEKIPNEKIPFEIEEIDWTWGWDDNRGETVYGYLIDIRDLVVHPNETLEELEKRIDQAIKPIKKYLSKKRPNLSNWWGQ